MRGGKLVSMEDADQGGKLVSMEEKDQCVHNDTSACMSGVCLT